MSPADLRAQGDPILDAKGFQQNRDYFSQEPFEHIDTFTGSLVLTFTDLVLPGNAGRDLRFTRTYNSKEGAAVGGGFTFGLGGMVMRVGNVLWPPIDTGTDHGVWLITGDGAEHHAATPLNPQGNGNESVRLMATDQFWTYERASRTLSMPDGTVSHFDLQGRLINRLDSFGNLISLSWEGAQLRVTQQLGSGQSREVVLALAGEGPAPGYWPTSMTYAGRTWNYETPPGSALTQVTPPIGPPWRYDYAPNQLTVTTPHGGQIRYTLETKGFLTGENATEMAFTTVVSDRDTFERGGVPLGHWHYAYDFPGPGISNQTTIEGPNTTTTYLHQVVASNPNNNAAHDYLGRSYVLQSRTVMAGGAELEREEQLYQSVPIRSANVADAVPELSQRIVHRNGRTYTTNYQYSANNFGDYHHPFQIVETGELLRTTTREFLHLAAPFIVGNVTRDTVASGGESFEQSWTYDLGTGFTKTHTEYGITTAFSPDPDAFGNVASATKNGKTTSFSHRWGLVSQIQTPEYTVTRLINPEGTIASETRAGRTTSFTYDGLFRIVATQPPGGTNSIGTDYDNTGGATVTVHRGASSITTTFDGFGKAIAATNGMGIQSRTGYDAEGRKTYEGYPFTGADTGLGTTITYDGLGRPVRLMNPDGTYSENTYGDGTISVRDENNHTTVQAREAFGNPDESRLAAVQDANLNIWAYTYNALGKLTRVTAPDGIVRSWAYNGNNLLVSETQPESGTTAYNEYDAGGNLKRKTDAKGTVFQYTYDSNDRVRVVDAGGQLTNISYEPGSDNRQQMSVGSVASLFEYEAATGRVASRTDTVDGLAFTTRYGYDANDNVQSISYPALGTATPRRQIGYDVDAENRITRVHDLQVSRDYASGIGYHPSGAVASFLSGNNIPNTITYDPHRYWVRTISAGPLQLAYNLYDGVGNVGQLTGSGMDQSFTYDAVDRLTLALGPYGSIGYDYDAHGNRSGNAFAYEPGTLRLARQNTDTFTYDNNGNLKTAPNKTYTYTPQNLLATATVSGPTTTYGYDADDWRVKKTTGGVTTYYLRGVHGELLTEWENPGPSGKTRDYMYAGSRLVSVISRPWTETSPDYSATILANGPTVSVSLTTPGRNGRLLFEGTAGERVSVYAVVTSGSFGCIWHLTILKPDGIALSGGDAVSCGTSAFVEPVALPLTGLYTILVDPSGTSTGTANVNLYDVVDVTGSITASGPTVPVSLTTPGRRALLTFTGTAGQRVSANAVVTSGSFGCIWHVTILEPDGTALPGGDAASCGTSAFVEPVALSVTGTYTLMVDPLTFTTGTANVALYDVVDVTGSITANGPIVPVSLTTPGRRALLTFTGTAGQRVSAYAGVTSGSFGCIWHLTIVKPDGTALTAGDAASCGTSAFVEPVALSVTGTYTLMVDPLTFTTGTANVTLYDVVDVTGSITANGPIVTVSLTPPGRRAVLTFTGTAGQRVSAYAGVTSGSFGCIWYLTILKPDGTALTGGDAASCGTSAFVEPVALSVTGSYTLVVDPLTANTGTATVNLYNVVDVTGSITLNGPAVPAALTIPGRRALLTFSGTAGQRVSAYAAITSGGFGCIWHLTILKPDGTALTGGDASSCGTWAFVEPLALPVPGTYTVLVDPLAASTGSATVTAFDVAADVTGSLSVNGATLAVALPSPGQNAQLTFAGTAGQQVTVRLTGNTIGSTTVKLLKPGGVQVTSNSSSANSFNLTQQTLLTTGTYTIVVDPSIANVGNITVAVTSP